MAAGAVAYESLRDLLDARTREVLERRRATPLGRRRGWLMRRMLLASDLVGLILAFALAQWLYASAVGASGVYAARQLALLVVALPLWVLAAKVAGLYDRDEERAAHSTADDVAGVFRLVTIGSWLLYAGAHVTGVGHPSLTKLLLFWGFAVVALPLLRGVARVSCRRSIYYLQNTLIVGAGEIGQDIARRLLKHPEYGINVVGFADGEPRERADDLEHLVVLGGVGEVPALVRLLDVERVVIAFSRDDRETLLGLVRDLNQLPVQVDLVPRFFEVLSPSADIHTVEGIPLLGLHPPHLSRSSRFVKRSLDVIGAGAGLLVLSPLLALIALAIRLESRGPVLFRQVRKGEGGRTFEILKFRTMVADAEARKDGLRHLNKHARRPGNGQMFKIDDDPRVTRVGRRLRRFSLDELPQLWNVLRGEMSLVGPRPLVLDEHAHVSAWAARRLDLRPGMTGLWQVSGRDEIAFPDMVKLDYVYVTSWSLGGDLRILFRTLPAVAGSRRTVAAGSLDGPA